MVGVGGGSGSSPMSLTPSKASDDSLTTALGHIRMGVVTSYGAIHSNMPRVLILGSGCQEQWQLRLSDPHQHTWGGDPTITTATAENFFTSMLSDASVGTGVTGEKSNWMSIEVEMEYELSSRMFSCVYGSMNLNNPLHPSNAAGG